MALFLGLLIFTFIITSILIVPFINFLYRIKFQRRDQRTRDFLGLRTPIFDKFHREKAGTPVGGGFLIIAVVSLLYVLLFPLISYLGVYITAFYPIKDELNILFFTFISFGLLGLYDDLMKFFGLASKGIFGLRLRWKFLIQWILAFIIAALLFQNLKIDFVNVPFFGVFDLGIFYVPLAAFIIVAFTNALNITDGLDGLASGLLLISLFAFWILSHTNLDTVLSIFLSFWIGALIAFLYFNVYPARIFLGDVGALSFGATLAVVGLLIGKIMALVVIGGLFVVEISSSLLQIIAKRLLGRKIFKVAPFHLWLQERGWEEPKIVMRAWLAGIMLAIFGLWLAVI
ncbi:MAG: phospho-N-acetylmuramoyl-pentapeptide-transferase [Patescibacteria group bacterium]